MADKKNAARSLAREYFISNLYSQKQISTMLGVSEKTIGAWKDSDGWEETRKAHSVTPIKLMMKMQAQLFELQAHIESRDEGQRFPDSKEADIQNKIAAGITRLQSGASLSENVAVLTLFIKHVSSSTNDLTYIKKVSEECNAFLKLKAEELA